MYFYNSAKYIALKTLSGPIKEGLNYSRETRNNEPPICSIIILDASFHVGQFIELRKSVDELSNGQQISLRNKIIFPGGMAQAFDLLSKLVYAVHLLLMKR